MIKLTNETANSSNGLSSGTYVVEDTITLTQDLTILNDVTLIFQGGKFVIADDCTENITISGTNTRLDAPICQIFGKGVNVTGTWDIDRAYPQWFELEDDNDWSSPINKAITMKNCGEVFLKDGVYYVSNTIVMPAGIHLVGENCQSGDANYDEGVTCIKPVNFGEKEYMLEINIGGKLHIDQSTVVRNIRFVNEEMENNMYVSRKCANVYGGVTFDSVVWVNFIQAVKFTEDYADTKAIVNCAFKQDPGELNDDNNCYAFEVCGLGDAFRFEHNAIHQTFNGKALILYHCGGASIQGNIINSDVRICGCKAVLFNANHCEGGMQVDIAYSNVTMNGNFYHRGSRPNVVVCGNVYADKSVVTMENEVFMQTNFTAPLEVTNEKDIVYALGDYDVKIDKNAILKLDNVYRYDIMALDFSKMYPTGISVLKITKSAASSGEEEQTEPFMEFNNYSYMASTGSEITTGFNLAVSGRVKDVNATRISFIQQVDNVCWLTDSGTYSYYYQTVWDEARGIKKTESATQTSKCTFVAQYYSDGKMVDENDLIEGKSGVLIGFSEDVNGNSAMIKLFRAKIGEDGVSELKCVSVPVCGTKYLYDNGISVCGYKWKECEDSFSDIQTATSDINMEMFRINNGNVECFTKKEAGGTPGTGWKRGDIIYNIGSTPSITVAPDDI